MNKINLTVREQKIMAVCIILILVFSGYQGVFVPIRRLTVTTEKRITELERKYHKASTIIAKSKKMEARQQVLLQDFKQTTSDEEVMSAMIKEIEGETAQISMKITDLKPQRVKKTEISSHFSVSLSVDGQLSDVMKFILAVQNPPHNFLVDEFQFSKSDSRTAEIRGRLALRKILVF